MKITEIIAHPLSAALAQGRWTAHEFMDRAQLVLVEVRTDQGIVGFGEIAGGPQTVICDLVKMFSRVVQGMDPLGHTEIWTKLFSLTSPRPGGMGGWDGMPAPLPRNQRPQIMAAIGGIDIALWDIKGKAAGLPVFRILGGTRTEVFTYATGGTTWKESHSSRADELAGFVSDGYRAVKLKCGALSLRDEVARIRAVREAIGPDCVVHAGHERALRCRGVHQVRIVGRAIRYASGWKSRCIGICSRPISSVSPLRHPFRWRTASGSGTATPSAISSTPARSVTCSSIPRGMPDSPNRCGSRTMPNRKAC